MAALSASAVPARKGVNTVTQPDGTTLQVCKYGDERLHFDVTADGYLLYQADDETYYYGRVNEAYEVVSTGVKAGSLSSARSGFEPVKFADVDVEAMYDARAKKPGFKSPVRRTQHQATTGTDLPQNGLGLFSSSFPSTGKIRTLIVLVEYQDIKFSVSNPAQYYENFFHQNGFSSDGGTGCVKQYFVDNSLGQFEPQFDVYGPITLKNNRVYYGANDSSGEDKLPYEMVIEACDQLDSTIDFSVYDMNKDGLIDNVYIFYAGVGEATSNLKNSVWPHQYDVREYGITKTYDGKTLGPYGCCNEWDYYRNKADGIGTFVHEFSHVLGLPDLYSVSYNSYQSKTPGEWSILDSGCYNNNSRTPLGYSIYERNAMGWMKPQLLGDPDHITLRNVAENNDGCIIQTPNTNEFFLLENRQKVGWDKYAPGHGMLVWRICYDSSVWTSNTVNNQAHQYVDIIEANNKSDNTNSTYMAGYPYPGTSNVTSLTSTTTPALKTYSGTAINCPITSIAESAGIITFDVAGGRSLAAPKPTATVGDDSFDVSWAAVKGATDYNVTVKYRGEAGEAVKHTADMGSGMSLTLPTGWTSSSSNVYSSAGYYGASAPSLLFATQGSWLQTAEFNGEVQGIKFWLRLSAYSASQSPSTVKVLGLVNGSWVTIQNISPTDNLEHTYTITDNIPAGVTQVRFEYNRSYGNYAIDDVEITVGGQPMLVLDGYDAVSTAGATTMHVANLLDGVDTYYVTVGAKSEDLASTSDTLTVKIVSSGVGNVAVDTNDTPATYYNLNGVKVDASHLQPGIYVKVSGGKAEKIYVK